MKKPLFEILEQAKQLAQDITDSYGNTEGSVMPHKWNLLRPIAQQLNSTVKALNQTQPPFVVPVEKHVPTVEETEEQAEEARGVLATNGKNKKTRTKKTAPVSETPTEETPTDVDDNN